MFVGRFFETASVAFRGSLQDNFPARVAEQSSSAKSA